MTDYIIAKAFDDKQPRDKDGKFAAEGGSGPDDIHSFTRGGTAPKSLNGVPIASWSKAPVGETNEGWSKLKDVAGADPHDLKVPKGKKSASGVIIHEPDGRVWLTKPTNEFGGYKHTWPKGSAEPDLTLQQNAIKEAYEETGLHVRITGHAGDYERDTSVGRYYHAVRVGGDPREHGWESEAVVLAPPAKLHGLLNRYVDQKIAHEHAGAPKPPPKPKPAPSSVIHHASEEKSKPVGSGNDWWHAFGFSSKDIKKSFGDALKFRPFGEIMKSFDPHQSRDKSGKWSAEPFSHSAHVNQSKWKQEHPQAISANKWMDGVEKIANDPHMKGFEKQDALHSLKLPQGGNAYQNGKLKAHAAAMAHTGKQMEAEFDAAKKPKHTDDELATFDGDGKHISGGIEPTIKDTSNWKKIDTAKGSNPGGIFEDEKGQKWYVKHPATPDHAKNELLTNKLYDALGVANPSPELITHSGGKLGIATKWNDNLETAKALGSKMTGAHVIEAQKHFAAHALVANWDAAGTGLDNQAFVKGTTKPVTVDGGGGLEYGAMGGMKPGKLGTGAEWDTMRDKGMSPYGHIMFGSMTASQLHDSAQAVKNLPDETITSLVHEHGPGDAAHKDGLAKKIISQKHAIIAKADALAPKEAPKAVEPEHDLTTKEGAKAAMEAAGMGHNVKTLDKTAAAGNFKILSGVAESKSMHPATAAYAGHLANEGKAAKEKSDAEDKAKAVKAYAELMAKPEPPAATTLTKKEAAHKANPEIAGILEEHHSEGNQEALDYLAQSKAQHPAIKEYAKGLSDDLEEKHNAALAATSPLQAAKAAAHAYKPSIASNIDAAHAAGLEGQAGPVVQLKNWSEGFTSEPLKTYAKAAHDDLMVKQARAAAKEAALVPDTLADKKAAAHASDKSDAKDVDGYHAKGDKEALESMANNVYGHSSAIGEYAKAAHADLMSKAEKPAADLVDLHDKAKKANHIITGHLAAEYLDGGNQKAKLAAKQHPDPDVKAYAQHLVDHPLKPKAEADPYEDEGMTADGPDALLEPKAAAHASKPTLAAQIDDAHANADIGQLKEWASDDKSVGFENPHLKNYSAAAYKDLMDEAPKGHTPATSEEIKAYNDKYAQKETTPESLIKTPPAFPPKPTATGTNAHHQKKYDALEAAAKSGDLAALEAIKTNPESANGVLKKVHKYKENLVAALKGGADIKEAPKAEAPIVKPPEQKKIAIDPAKFPAKPQFLASNPAFNAENETHAAAMKELAAKGDVAGLKAYDKFSPNSNKLNAYKLALAEDVADQLNPPVPLKIDSATGTLKEVSDKFPPHKAGTKTSDVPKDHQVGFYIALGKVDHASIPVPKAIDHQTGDAFIKQQYKLYASISNKAGAGDKTAGHALAAQGGVQGGGFQSTTRNGNWSKETRQKANAFVEHFATDMPSGTKLYKNTDIPDGMIEQLMKAEPGTIIQETGTSPMTYMKNNPVTQKFGPHVIEMTTLPGYKGAPVFGSGGFAGEKEITALPGTRMMIQSVTKKSNGALHIKVLGMPTAYNSEHA